MARISQGDELAFTSLLGRHLGPVHSYLARMTASSTEAEDLAQETFLRIWRKADSYRPGKVRASTWIYTIAHNLFVDAYRKNREITNAETLEIEDQNADPAHAYTNLKQLQRLQTAIAALPDQQRSALLLCQVQGFSNIEAAQIMHITSRALESLLARARRSLRIELFDNENALS